MSRPVGDIREVALCVNVKADDVVSKNKAPAWTTPKDVIGPAVPVTVTEFPVAAARFTVEPDAIFAPCAANILAPDRIIELLKVSVPECEFVPENDLSPVIDSVPER